MCTTFTKPIQLIFKKIVSAFYVSTLSAAAGRKWENKFRKSVRAVVFNPTCASIISMINTPEEKRIKLVSVFCPPLQRTHCKLSTAYNISSHQTPAQCWVRHGEHFMCSRTSIKQEYFTTFVSSSFSSVSPPQPPLTCHHRTINSTAWISLQ